MRLYKRRLVSILSGDVASFCRLVDMNEDATFRTLKRYRALIATCVDVHRGRIFGVAGDSWMAEFENPIAAVNCATVIQQELAIANASLPAAEQVAFRIGVHMGDVIADGGDLFGNVLNVAARLQEIAPVGGVVISALVHSYVTGKVDVRFTALGECGLKNMQNPVSAYKAEMASSGAGSEDEAVSVIDLAEPVPGFDRRPAVAVLPFTSLDPLANTDYIGDGLADDLINGLSRAIWFPVISRSSSFAFRAASVGTKAIGQALGARYLVSGTIRPSAGGVMRLTVSLADTETGISVWSACYDVAGASLLRAEDEVLCKIASVIDAEVNRAEQNRCLESPREDFNTWEMVRAGVWHMNRLTKEDSVEARRLFEAALQKAPGSAETRIQLGWWYFVDVWSQRGDKAGLEIMSRLAWEALRLDGRDARPHLLLGIGDVMSGRPVEARPRLEEAIRLNPSLAPAHSTLASSYILAGDPVSAIEPLLVSMRLNPEELYRFHFLGELAMAFFLLENWAKASEFAGQSLQLRPGYWYARAIQVASLAESGRLDKARETLATHEKEYGRIKNSQIDWVPFVDRVWNQKLIEGLNKARAGSVRTVERITRSKHVAVI